MKRLLCHLTLILGAIAIATPARSETILAGFESGNLDGWTITGDAWSVGGATNSSPNVTPPQGNFFARSGAPNTSSETNIGTVTSPLFSMTSDTLTWFAAGWSGSPNNGQNSFQILDSGSNVLAQITAPESDGWKTLSTNLISDGLTPGADFYLRAIDSDSSSNYAWIAMDDISLSGPAVAPEPGSYGMLLLGLGGVAPLFFWRTRAIKKP